MTRYLVVAAAAGAVALGSLAAPAAALVDCETGDVQCYQTCYLPQIEKGSGIYWYNC